MSQFCEFAYRVAQPRPPPYSSRARDTRTERRVRRGRVEARPAGNYHRRRQGQVRDRGHAAHRLGGDAL